MTETTAPQRAGLYRLVAIVLSIAFFVTPYLFQFGAPKQPGKDAVVGAEIVGDGMYLVTRNETLVGIQNGDAGLLDTLTAPWWDSARADQALWRPVPLFFLGVASSLSGEPYNPDNPGDAPLPYHLIVLAFHVLATMLLFDLALELAGSEKVAFVAAALFATLTVHAEVILDIAGIAELCAAAFGFGAWRLWLKAGPKPLANPGALAGSLALVALAALSKESAFALPLVFFLVDAGRGAAKGMDWKAAFAKLPGLVAMAVVLGVILAVRINLVGLPEYTVANELDNPLIAAGGFERVMNAARLMSTGVLVMFGINPLRGSEGFHFGELFGFSADYSATQIQVLGAFSLWNLVGALALIVSIVVALRAAKRCGTRGSLWLAMLASMLVTSNLLFPIGTVFGERLYYFPSALLVLIIAMTLVRFGKAGIAVGVLASLGYGYATNIRADDFSSNKKYFQVTAVKDAPQSAKALYNYGTYLVAIDTSALAEDKFKEAIERFPKFAAAKGSLGLAYAEALKYEEALVELVGDLDIQLEAANYEYEPDPQYALLGPSQLLILITELRVYNASIERPQEHLDWLDALIAKGYASPVAHALRGRTLLKLGRVDEAIAAYERSLSIGPTFGAVRYYGELLRKLNRNDDAIALYDQYAQMEAVFTDRERAEFLLKRADAELVRDPLVALKTLEEQVAPFDKQLSAEQAFLYHWTWSQAQLENMPADSAGQRAKLDEIQARLKAGLRTFNEANEVTYSAQYALVNIFLQTGNYKELIPTAEDMLKFRPAPLLRTTLATALDQIAEYDRAQEHWRKALEELTEKGTDATTLYTTRRGLLISLSREGDMQSVGDEISAWQAQAAGEEEAWVFGLAVDWAAGWNQLEQAVAWAAECRAGYPDFHDFDQLFDQLPKWQAPADFITAYSLAQQRMGWGNFEGVVAAGQLGLSLTSDNNEKALISGPVASALQTLGRTEEAAEQLRAALALEIAPELRAQIQAVLDEMTKP